MAKARDSIQSMTAICQRIVLYVAAVALALSISLDVSADGKVQFLSDQLKNNPDFRVRTKAALSLGTSDDAGAVKPLCGCLDDGTETEAVPGARPATLGKMKKAWGDGCLTSPHSDSVT